MAWLQARLGLVLGALLAYAAKAWIGRLSTVIIDYFKSRRRAREQAAKQVLLEQDVQESKPRTDEVREHEEQWLNS